MLVRYHSPFTEMNKVIFLDIYSDAEVEISSLIIAKKLLWGSNSYVVGGLRKLLPLRLNPGTSIDAKPGLATLSREQYKYPEIQRSTCIIYL